MNEPKYFRSSGEKTNSAPKMLIDNRTLREEAIKSASSFVKRTNPGGE